MSGLVIVDYGMGNLRSVQKAFEICGCRAALSREAGEIEAAEALVVPGVGAFGDCIVNLERYGLKEAVRSYLLSGRPYLGICLGLQILFTSSDEAGGTPGLDVIPGRVRRFRGAMKVPHMGWNTLDIRRRDVEPERGAGGEEIAETCPLFRGIENGTYVYFVHSYYASPDDDSVVSTLTDYGGRFASAVWKENIIAVQFHPEKSQGAGLKMISNFIDFAESGDDRHSGG